MPKDVLIEIGMEEVPARFIRDAAEQLKHKIAAFLKESRIEHGNIRVFATPRRMAVLFEQTAEGQQDIREDVKGPSKKIAMDDNGDWTKAALGFARSQGVEPASLSLKDVNGTQYVFAVKEQKGGESAAVLGQALPELISSMTFPKNMRWGSGSLRFVRPIRWIAALFGDDIIPFEIAGVPSGRISRGHRFLGRETEIASPSSYVTQLEEQYVIADMEKRKQHILDQIQALSAEQGWHVEVSEELLEEVLFLVEYPTVLFGSFSSEFLHIPQEALITSMREHQRYFPVLDEAGKLLPHFVTVRNGDDRALDQVAKGNEKVLRARLSDAAFFYREDQKLKIDDALQKLESIVFHEELGSMGEKVRRIQNLAGLLADQLQAKPQQKMDALRTAQICKFDLVTQMVYEFPELQGSMGQDYALKAGERESVARAIYEHYMPRFSGDSAPASPVGAIVSMADKLDTITGFFSIGIIPTGSADPYALRRQASGIVQIIQELKQPLLLTQLFVLALNVYKESRGSALKREDQDILDDLMNFFGLRVKNTLQEKSIRYDVIDAVMLSEQGFDNVQAAVTRADVLMDALGFETFKKTVESFNRVNNLAAKADNAAIQANQLQEASEQALYNAWQEAHKRFGQDVQEGRWQQAFEEIASLQDPITVFFDQVMVMDPDEQIRRNRLALLSRISADLKSFADFSKVVL